MNSKIISCVFLDRDGVINYDSPNYIRSPAEWRPISGSLEAIARLNRANICVIVLSNQSGIARGYFTEETLAKIHQKMIRALKKVGGKIDKIYFCPHDDRAKCNCRKPKIGLFEKAKCEFNIDLHRAVYIGDKYVDYIAAQNAACRFILVKTGYGEQTLAEHPELVASGNVASDLNEAVSVLL